MIWRTKGGHELRVTAPDGVPPVGAVVNDVGQFYYVVESVGWRFTNSFFRMRVEAVVTLREVDRAEEGLDQPEASAPKARMSYAEMVAGGCHSHCRCILCRPGRRP